MVLKGIINLSSFIYRKIMNFTEMKSTFCFDSTNCYIPTLGRAQDYFCFSSGLEYLLGLCKATKSPAVCRATLYTLAMATEGNGEFQVLVVEQSFIQLLGEHCKNLGFLIPIIQYVYSAF